VRSIILVTVNPAISLGYKGLAGGLQSLDAEDWWAAFEHTRALKNSESYVEVANSTKNFVYRKWVGANEIAVACLNNEFPSYHF